MNIKVAIAVVGLALMLLLTISATGPVFAEPLEDAKAAIKKKDYDTALHLLEPLARRGVAEGQTELGQMYASGYGVKEDYNRAHELWQAAAEKNMHLHMRR